MDLRELENYRLSDAVKFNQQLNPRLWGSDEHLLPEVRERLLAMADDFREFLGVDDLEIKDITVSGSNAAYTYTPHSDIDLHLVVDMASVCDSDIMRELFDAKKYQYNDQHNFKIGGYDVELYVQDAAKPHHSQGIYSVITNDWVEVPQRRRPQVNDASVKNKYEDLAARVDAAIESGDLERMDALARKIRDMRQAGLDQHGEFGAENLAFKVMRGNGTLDRLRQARMQAKDSMMSLAERKKKKNQKKFRYGAFGGYYYPGYHYYGDSSGEGGDGGESVKEGAKTRLGTHMPVDDLKQTLNVFARDCMSYLNIENPPELVIKRDPEWTRRNGTFGRYEPDNHRVVLAINNRHTIDILRTMAHELTHARQHELGQMDWQSGETGSPQEDVANAMAGRIMRHWAELHPENFEGVPLEEQELDEGMRERLGALAAAACIAGTPGCATTGSTVTDVLGGVQAAGRAAQTIKQTGTAGARELVIQRTKDELRRRQGQVVPEDYDADHPPGPETPPTMGYTVTKQEQPGSNSYKLVRNQNIKEASGYIPVNDREAQDPRYSMALTPDIRPGETQRQAKKMGWKTDRAGRPPRLMKNLHNQLKEELEIKNTMMRAQEFIAHGSSAALQEGIHDPAIFKAVFIVGGPGSGKSHVSKQLGLGAMGLVTINSDHAFEYLMRKHDLDPKMPPQEKSQRDAVRDRAKSITNTKTHLALDGRLGLHIDGTGADFVKIKNLKDNLDALGYDSYLIIVNTDLDLAKRRNQLRNRSLPDKEVESKWEAVQANLGKYTNLFSNYSIIDNNGDEEGTNSQLLAVYKKLQKFLSAGHLKPAAKTWMDQKMKIRDILKEARLGGFPVKKLNIADSGDINEEIKPYVSQSGRNWEVLDYQGKTVFSTPHREMARSYLQKHWDELRDPRHTMGAKQLDELKIDAPQRRMSRDELQAYADRIKTGTKTKQDKFAPIIHGSNIKAITRDDGGAVWDLDDLAQQITTRPRQILGTNAKMEKSKGEGEIIYDLTLPALSGIVVDEDNGDFVEITTCPGAGECQLFCYARKGGYVMFPASSMSAAQALNFLVNDPQGYMSTVNREITTIKNRAAKNDIKLVVRWHDAGDFFSKEYLDLAFDIARAHPDVDFYAYTKIADVATADKPDNFLINFSSGSKRGEEKKIEFFKSQGNVPKEGVTVPRDMFFDLIAREGNRLIKDAKGRTQFKSDAALDTFRQRLAQQYKIDPDTIITYDEMLATPTGSQPRWNVIVQPGAGDRAANRRDVINSFLMFH